MLIEYIWMDGDHEIGHGKLKILLHPQLSVFSPREVTLIYEAKHQGTIYLWLSRAEDQ